MRQLLLLAILLAFMAGIVAWKAFSEAPKPILGRVAHESASGFLAGVGSAVRFSGSPVSQPAPLDCENPQADYIVGPE